MHTAYFIISNILHSVDYVLVLLSVDRQAHMRMHSNAFQLCSFIT